MRPSAKVVAAAARICPVPAVQLEESPVEGGAGAKAVEDGRPRSCLLAPSQVQVQARARDAAEQAGLARAEVGSRKPLQAVDPVSAIRVLAPVRHAHNLPEVPQALGPAPVLAHPGHDAPPPVGQRCSRKPRYGHWRRAEGAATDAIGVR